jgi:predicted PurR-regulated permease PerM
MTIPIPDRQQLKRWVVKAAFIALFIYVIYVVREIWLPLGLAFLIATVLDPVVDRLEARGFSRAAGAAVIFSAFILALSVGLWFLIPAMAHQAEEMQGAFSKYFPDMSPKGIRHSLETMHTPNALVGVATQSLQGLRGGFEKTSTWLTAYGMQFLTNLIWVVIIPIVAFYALRDFHLILGKGLLLVPRERRDVVQTYVAEVTAIFAKYLRGLLLVSALNGIATYLLLFVLKVPSALLLGVVAGVLYSVPYVGALITIVLTASISFISGGPNHMLVVVAASVVLHQIVFDQVISPRILGGHVGLHPILSIIALLAGNLLLGIIGMILAVPVAACIQIGVLALVPKLGQDISVATNTDPSEPLRTMEAETKEAHAATDATHDLHQSVQQAVNKVERDLEPDPVDPADEVTE